MNEELFCDESPKHSPRQLLANSLSFWSDIMNEAASELDSSPNKYAHGKAGPPRLSEEKFSAKSSMLLCRSMIVASIQLLLRSLHYRGGDGFLPHGGDAWAGLVFEVT
jgi:hypothetical protein